MKIIFFLFVALLLNSFFLLDEKGSHNISDFSSAPVPAFSNQDDKKGLKEDQDGGPMEAMKQEYALTYDRKLGRVPRERLRAGMHLEKELTSTHGMHPDAITSGVTWTERGPNNVGGRTEGILFDPNDATHNTVWSGGVDGGLWKTTNISNASPTWTAINDFFANLAVTTIAYDPTNTQILYFGTGEGWYNADEVEGDGIWQSTNDGATWSQLSSTNNANFYFIQKIVVQPTTGYVFAGTRNGVFESKDKGATWSQVLYSGNGSVVNQCSDLEIAADNTIYAGMGLIFSGTDGVYKSSTGAIGTWSKLNTGANGFPTSGFERVSIACAPSNSAIIYVLTQASYCAVCSEGIYHIYKSTNSGTTWTTIANPSDASAGTDFTNGQAWYDLAIAVDPNSSNTVFIGGLDLLKSTNGGTSWTQITLWYTGGGFTYVHADQHIILFQPGSSSTILFGNDGGVWETTNSGTTITDRDHTYNVTQYYGCALNPGSGSNQMMCGAQDNGTQQYSSAGLNATTQVIGGDGCLCFIDQNNATYQFGSYVYNNYYRSTNGGASFTQVISGNYIGSFVNPCDYDNTQKILYAQYTNSGSSGYFVRYSGMTGTISGVFFNVPLFNSGNVTHVHVSPNTANRVFFGLSNGRIVRADNANATPTVTLIGTPTNANVSCIAVAAGNDNQLLATYSNYGATHVWETTNGGTTWTSVQGNLTDIPVWWAIIDPYNANIALIATELGVWMTTSLNGASTVWVPVNSGLANVRVSMLTYRTSDHLMLAATHGRGLYSSASLTPVLPITLSSFTAEPVNNIRVLLKWTTQTEINNSYFNIQRSEDGENFKNIGKIAGQGNSTTAHNYSFTDQDPPRGNSYYRLQQMDDDDNSTYSSIDKVYLTFPYTVQILPNPVSAVMHVAITTNSARHLSLAVTNLQGVRLSALGVNPSNGVNTYSFLLNNYPAGEYFLTVNDEDFGESATYKFLKQ